MEVDTDHPMPINDIQNEIIDEFSYLGTDRESTVYYIMELGQRLPPLEDKYKIDENIIKGCQSKVWLHARCEEDRVYYASDSNTEITKGLISLLIRVLSGQPADEIINTDLYFIERIGMGQIIGSQRSNGLVAMIKQMKLYALAFKSKIAR